MIALIGLILIVGWVWLALRISRPISGWLSKTKYGRVLPRLVFPVVLLLPMADEIIGRWQFHRLCEREALVTLSPDWEKVRRARRLDDPIVTTKGYVIPIRLQQLRYEDIDTKQLFLTINVFHTQGGFLFGRLGLGLGRTTSCSPDDRIQIFNKLNIDQLLKQGAAK